MYESSFVNLSNILLSSELVVFFVQQILSFRVWGHVVIMR